MHIAKKDAQILKVRHSPDPRNWTRSTAAGTKEQHRAFRSLLSKSDGERPQPTHHQSCASHERASDAACHEYVCRPEDSRSLPLCYCATHLTLLLDACRKTIITARGKMFNAALLIIRTPARELFYVLRLTAIDRQPQPTATIEPARLVRPSDCATAPRAPFGDARP